MPQGYPPSPWRANAYRIHGPPDARAYLAATPLPGPQPDFHQPQRFAPVELPAVGVGSTVRERVVAAVAATLGSGGDEAAAAVDDAARAGTPEVDGPWIVAALRRRGIARA